jgi:hypothetical protein
MGPPRPVLPFDPYTGATLLRHRRLGAQPCRLLSGFFADCLQLSLAAIGIGACGLFCCPGFGVVCDSVTDAGAAPAGGLIVKRCYEEPPRPWRIWILDVSKQGLGR